LGVLFAGASVSVMIMASSLELAKLVAATYLKQNWDIISGFNNQTIISNCITALQNQFNIEKWQINQPIIISEIMTTLLQVKGVQSVTKLEIINKQDPTGLTYSQYAYDIPGATRNGNIYTSADPSVFEIRYPDTDIQGRVVTY
jgi:hypothetical protein